VSVEGFEKGVTHIGDELEQRLQRFRKLRSDKSLIKTRTYISSPQNPLEKDLYEKHIHSEKGVEKGVSPGI